MSNATVIQQTAFLQAQQSSSVEEYIVHPDFRIVAAFFLGWVFLSSLAHIIRSNFIRYLFQECCNPSCFGQRLHRSNQPADPEKPPFSHRQQSFQPQDGVRREDPSHNRSMDDDPCTFALNICFVFASFAQFCSLLAFSSTGGRTGCTFVVAWGGMASQAGRLAGLLLLSFELQRRGIKNLERCTLWSGMFIALVFVFAFNATNTGTLDFVPQLGISICDRQHVLSTSVSRSISFLLLELYVAGRLISLTLSRPCRLSNFTAVLVSHDAAKAESLIIVDILALIPIAVHGSVLSQFIPVSVGSLLVLAVFNHRTLPSIQNLDGKISTTSVCVVSTESRSPNADVCISRTRESSGRNSDAIVKNHEHGTQALVGDHYSLGIHLSSLPYSAPARIGWRFLPEESAPGSHQILPLQAQYAERFDQPVIQVGPVLKPLRDRPQVQVVIEAEESIRGSRTIPSSIIGSDIIRPPSRKTRKDTKAWSPASIAPSTYLTYSAHDSYLTTRSAYRDSSHSTRTASSHALSAASDDTRSRRSGRDLQRSRSGQSPKESSLKAPWRGQHRVSSVSARKGELPTVVEGPSDVLDNSSPLFRVNTRRTTFGRPSVKSVTQVPPGYKYWKAYPPIAVPNPAFLHHLSFIHGTASSAPPTSPVSIPHVQIMDVNPPVFYERPHGMGKLKGPRSSPSASYSPNGVSSDNIFEADTRSQRRSSCPELPPFALSE